MDQAPEQAAQGMQAEQCEGVRAEQQVGLSSQLGGRGHREQREGRQRSVLSGQDWTASRIQHIRDEPPGMDAYCMLNPLAPPPTARADRDRRADPAKPRS
ncbi:hypothetical protein GCM10011581_24060 [Saccharopolyspora subtropica]|uniref:Uncharacterized protein n=1 Tax=Saccharopolyspora thermophila TaxID=89367 RepID=A0A917JX13_9PSEU|nr:hypothetical protein GCM10011581_24060 [Saccharopolyspora subtropica]